MTKYTETDLGKVLIEWTGDSISMGKAIIAYATEFGFDEETTDISEFYLDDADNYDQAYYYIMAIEACQFLTELQCENGIEIFPDKNTSDLIIQVYPTL
jgi:hypothetical protein